MKKIKKLFLIISGILFLSGCEMKQTTILTINQDKSLNADIDIALDYELLDTMISIGEGFGEGNDKKTHTKEERIKKFKENAQIEDKENVKIFDDGKYLGYKMNTKIDNIDSLVDNKKTTATTKNLGDIKEQKIFTKKGNTYKGKITIEHDEEEKQYNEAIENGLKVTSTFIVNLPEKVISSNATHTSKDGKTLTWDLTKNIESIEFEFSFKQLLDKKLITAAIVSLILAIFIVIIIMLVINKTKNYKQDNSLEKTTTISQIEKKENIVPIDIPKENKQSTTTDSNNETKIQTEPSTNNVENTSKEEQNPNNNQI